jgi:succinyl-diaminopimelate desuccinylase
MISPEVGTGGVTADSKKLMREATALLQDLVRLPSVNGRDPERPVVERLLEAALQLGLDGELVAGDDARPNALVHWGEGQEAFAFIAHSDTVSEGRRDAWSFPPFGAEVHNGRLYGRGAADNKGGMVAALFAIASVADSGRLDPSKHALLLAAVADEESGASSPIGLKHMLQSGRLDARGAVYTYAGDDINLGHRGLLRLTLTAHGRSVHTGSPGWSRGEQGVNAVTGLAEVLLQLESLQWPVKAAPGFEHLGCKLTAGTLIEGGTYASVVPDQATAVVDVRLLPGQSAEGVVERIHGVAVEVCSRRPGLRVDHSLDIDLPPASIPPDHRLVKTAGRIAGQITKRDWPARAAGPANEGYMLIGAGVPTLCGFGPLGGNAHAADEWIDLHSLVQTIDVYAELAVAYLTEEQEQHDGT